MNGYILGIDTSNYCTSLCLLDAAGDIVAERRKWLPVPRGARGLRQGEGVFHHVQQLGELWCSIDLPVEGALVGVCASTAPRPSEKSYMPVFTVGRNWGQSLAHLQRVPFFETTHQEGHIAAALGTADRPLDRIQSFTALHLSGGTSDMLYVERTGDGYAIEKVGGSTDSYAGQLVDRVGVALGLPFPAGGALEKLARNCSGRLSVPTAVDGTTFSFSGPETALLRLIASDEAPQDIARAAENAIAKTVEKALLNAFAHGLPKRVLLVGGVAANVYIRQRLKHRLEHRAVGAALSFADVRYSGDNAYGVAAIGWAKHKRRSISER
ncbi:Kae1-like domain-containing protein [Numidum massiliense]|uniref:Kae1-like domain-containing protein n=1 Tax=Numidum massiliense TaxID=1522315 RepID=UPI0006D59D4B|nr:hypothetical protein [Numidum massiliense]